MPRASVLPWSGIAVLVAAGALVSAQGNRRRTDFSPLDLPGGSRVEFREMDSRALRGRGQYSIFFPPSYRKGQQRYPVVYFLHGLFNDHTSWTVSRHGNLPALIERLMLEKKIPEMLLVHPNGGRSFYTNYRDGSLRYEDFVVQELVVHVESQYRAKGGRRHRAMAGTSMGGYGALKIAMKYPGRYTSVAAHSPIVFPTRNPLDVPPEMKSSRRFQFFSNMFVEIYGDPLDQAYYDANNPLVLAREQNLQHLGIYFDYGTADRYNSQIQLGMGLRKLSRALSEAGVPYVFHEHPGEPHGWALVMAHIHESLGFIGRRF
ncbi:MAG: alpha/beta hydrolase [Acidobacteriota bacterium]